MKLSAVFVSMIAVSMLVASFARPVHADNKDKADALFKQGKKLMAEQHYADACEAFEKSNQLDPGIGSQLNIAKCYEEWGKIGRAFLAYQAAEKSAKDAKDPREPKIHQLVVKLEPSVPHLTIKLPRDAPSDLKVTFDNRPVDKLGESFVVDPGPHTIEWSITGGAKNDKVVVIERGGDSEVTLDIPKTVGTKTGDTKTVGTKTVGTKTGDTKTGDTKTGDTKTGDTKTGDTKTGDTKTGDTKTGDTKTGDTKTGDTKTGDTKTGGTKTGDRIIAGTGGGKSGGPKVGSTSAPQPRGRNQRLVGISLAGVGVIAIGISSYVTLSARSKYNDALETHCNGMPNACDPTGLEITHDARSTANKGTIVFIIGAALVGGGAAVYFLAPNGPPPARAEARSSFYISPAVSPDGVGVVLGGKL